MKRLPAFVLLFLWIPALALARPEKGPEPAKDSGPWIHVEVLDGDEEKAEVRVNVPLSLADLALDLVEKEGDFDRHMRLDHGDVSIEDLRKIWKELRAAGDAEFVTVKEADQTVRVARVGDAMHVDIAEMDGGTVKIQIPVVVVDALLGGTGETLDLEAAIAQIKTMDRGEIVRVQDGSESIRVWID